MQWYEVALWRWWPALFPDCTAKVWAWNAFSAVEWVMREHGLALVGYAAVYAEDRSVIYRVYKVAVMLEDEVLIPAADETVCRDGFVVGNVEQYRQRREARWESD